MMKDLVIVCNYSIFNVLYVLSCFDEFLIVQSTLSVSDKGGQ